MRPVLEAPAVAGRARLRTALLLALAFGGAGALAWYALRPAREPPDPLTAELRAALAAARPEAKVLELGTRWLQGREEALGGRSAALFKAVDDLAFEVSDGCPAVPGSCGLAELLWGRVSGLAAEVAGADRAEVLANLAWLDFQQGRWEAAERRHRDALDLRRADHDAPLALAGALTDLGNDLYFQGRYGEAGAQFEEALALYLADQGDADPVDLATLYLGLGELRRIRGEVADAEASFQAALGTAARAREPDDLLRANILNSLGALYWDQGDNFRAEVRFLESLRLREGLPPDRPRGLGTAYLSLGALYRTQGDYEQAETFYRRALAAAETELGADHSRLVWFYDQQAQLFAEQGRSGEAIPLYEQALERSLALGENHPLVARSRRQLAHQLVGVGEPGDMDRAGPLYEQALQSQERLFGPRHPEVAVTLTYQAARLVRAGGTAATEPAAVRRLLDRALAIFAATPVYPEVAAEALALRARLYRRAGERDKAFADLERSLAQAESLRLRAGGGEGARMQVFARFLPDYQLMIRWQVEDGRLDRAVEYAERSRARALVDQLLAARVDLRRGIPEDRLAPLAAREAAAKQQLAGLNRRIVVAEGDFRLDPGQRRANLEDLYRQLAEARREFVRVEEALLGESQLWRQTAGRSPVSLEQIQGELAPVDGALLLYAIGDEGGYLFVLTRRPDAAKVFSLEVAPAAARILGVPPGALTRQTLRLLLLGRDGQETGILPRLQAKPAAAGRPDDDLDARLHALFAVLVPPPAWRTIEDRQEVVIVPDDALHMLPFEALIVSPPADAGEPRYWIDRESGPRIRYAASATALDRGGSALVDPLAHGPGTILSVSDPLLPQRPGPLRAAVRGGMGLLGRLPGTAEETAALVKSFGLRARGGEVEALQREQATEANVRRALAGKRYVHFGTHGIVDEHWNGLFASLLLSPPSAENPDSDDDGLLQLFEIYQVKLDCDLVVLSACSTHVGPQVGGEGVFGLSRAFAVAGARRVVASLWQVDDCSSATLMRGFFERLGKAEKAGRRPPFAAALWEAKRQLRREPGLGHPYFWAPLVLHGEG